MSLADPYSNYLHPITMAIISVRCSNPSVALWRQLPLHKGAVLQLKSGRSSLQGRIKKCPAERHEIHIAFRRTRSIPKLL